MDPLAHFLLVDDDPIFLAVAESVVAMLGDHDVVTATNGAEGLDALEAATRPFDVIILDLNMPDLDGLAFLRGAAGLGFNGRVVISSGENEAVLRSARRMGEMLGVKVVGALKKPLSAPVLAELLAAAAAEPKAANSGRIALPGSLDALELVPYYQAQHDADDGTVHGVEALIRARAPDGSIHGPGKLFGLIHSHAELVSTTLSIARKVLADMRTWQAEGLCRRTSINLDASVAEDPAVGPALVALVKESGVSPELVCLELTESALPTDMTRLIEALARLRMAGFELSLDDYGTGGSNFELLRLCPFTELKIDGSVIRSAADEPIARRFMEATVAMAAELGVAVVGEGVETPAQLDLARWCGVGVIQGFLFSRPVPAAAMRDLLAAKAPPLRRAG